MTRTSAAAALPRMALPPSERHARLSAILQRGTTTQIVVLVDHLGSRVAEHFRAFDCLFDSLETFWEEPEIALTLVVPGGQLEAVQSGLFTVPRLRLEVVTPDALLAGAGLVSAAGRSALALAAAAACPMDLTLVLTAAVFPVAPLSGRLMIDLLADGVIHGAAAPGLQSCALIENEAARAALAGNRAGLSGHAVRRALAASDLAEAGRSLAAHPLVKRMTLAECAATKGRGLGRGPWRPAAVAPLLEIVGFESDPSESAIAVVYSALHR